MPQRSNGEGGKEASKRAQTKNRREASDEEGKRKVPSEQLTEKMNNGWTEKNHKKNKRRRRGP